MAEQRRKRKKKVQSEYYFDYSLLFIVLFLLGFGLVMIYSTSSYEAFQDYDGNAAYYLKKQLIATILGLAAMTVVANIPYHFWENFAVLGYLILLIIPFGKEGGGATRWLRVPGIGFSLQPAEVAKLCMILFLACLVCKMGKSVRTMKGFIIMMCVPMPLALMIWKITDNLSSAIIIMGIAVLMVFVASPDYRKFIIMGLLVVAGVIGIVFMIKNASSTTAWAFEANVSWPGWTLRAMPRARASRRCRLCMP